MLDLPNILASTGLPVAYREFKKPPSIPFIVYVADESNNFAADNVVYQPFTNYDIELYTENKDPAREALIETILTDNEIYYDKLEAWIESEELYQVSYSIQI